jgi:nucleotide-binding universal stress UspA family protein
MEVLAWVTEATWPACVGAMRDHVPPDARVTLLYVADDDVPAAARGAFVGMLGRSGGASPDPAVRVEALAALAGRELLDAAALEAGREVTLAQRHGRVEREVVSAAAGADLLILARDGDLRRLGPHSLGPTTRFVVDHAPCAILLVWPSAPPTVGSIPPPPPHPPHRAGPGPRTS